MAEDERGFTIVDKRGGEDEASGEEPGGGAAAESGSEAPRSQSLPPADFTSLLLSLATSALYHLGQVDDPKGEGPSELNLPLARHAIGTLEVLQQKTQGNRSEEETGLLSSLLTDLRLRFVEASKR